MTVAFVNGFLPRSLGFWPDATMSVVFVVAILSTVVSGHAVIHAVADWASDRPSH